MKERADKVLTDLGLVPSRSQAKSLIEKGDVQVNGKALSKAGELIDPSAEIQISSPLFVGRGAFKLESALAHFAVPIPGKVLMDIGASTGGFTEVLLKNGASKVYAIDVGVNQLAAKLRQDPRVISMEGVNIKDLQELPEGIEGAVMDLSFISITKVIDRVYQLLLPGSFLIALIKPQFEVGVQRLPKDGVVKDEALREQILQEVIAYAEAHGWKCQGSILSPIEGKSGNVEYLAHLIRD